MNKPELEAKLRNYEERLKDITKAIKETRERLNEPEKPKLRHGDFGYADEPQFPRIVLADNQLASAVQVFKYHENDKPTIILGNVFDLLKEWSEPFEEWENGSVEATEISIKDDKIRLYACTGANCEKEVCHCQMGIERAESFWRKLGHAIAELKRKENKCS